jgi:hypothetical protein
MKTSLIALILAAVTTQMEGCEKVRLFERIYDMYANWHSYDMFAQIMLIIWTLGLGIMLIFIGKYLTTKTTNTSSK